MIQVPEFHANWVNELETDAKKLDWLKISPVVKNLQFLSDQAEIQAILPTHELFILTKFHQNWQKIVDFVAMVKFCASPVFFASVSSKYELCQWYHFKSATPILKIVKVIWVKRMFFWSFQRGTVSFCRSKGCKVVVY